MSVLRLFAYSTMRDPRAAASVLGRELNPSSAQLPGYKRSTETHDGTQWPTVVVSEDDASRSVRGVVYYLSEYDFAVMDAWQKGYSRFLANLGDHQPAWVYYYVGGEGGEQDDQDTTSLTKSASSASAPHPTTGPEALAYLLSKLQLDDIEEAAFKDIQSGKKTVRPAAEKRLAIVQGLRRNKAKPSDMVIDSIPVVPSVFRPYTIMGDMLLAGDVNELYQDLITMRTAYDDLASSNPSEEILQEFKPQVYGAAKAVMGYGDPVTQKGLERNTKGFLQKVLGTGPKYSFLNRQILSKPQDFVSRGVIGVDADLGMDEIAIPKEQAWGIFSLPIQRRLVKSGLPVVQAVEEWSNRTERSEKALRTETKERPVLYSRAPVWHKHGEVAGYARLIDGDQIKINPVATTGLNADFDGDLQIGKVLILIDLEAKYRLFGKSSSYLDLTLHDKRGNLLPMYKKLCIPSFDPTHKALMLCDLEDLPTGLFSNTKEDGRNGPIHFYHAILGTQVIAYDEKENKSVWADVSYISEHPGREIEIVTLSDRRQIFTDDDPRAVYGVNPWEDFKLDRFTPTEAAKYGVIVPVVRSLDRMFGEGDLEEVVISNNEECPFHKLPLDFDFGYFCGAMAGDGWWDKLDYTSFHPYSPRSIYLSDLKGQVAERIESFIKWSEPMFQDKKLFAKESYPDRYGNTVRHSWNFPFSKELARWMDLYLGGTRNSTTSGSGTKILPTFLHRAPREYRVGLLTGFLDTDGSVSISNAKRSPQLMVACTSTSLRLLRDVQFLSLTLGVRSTISFSKETVRGNTSWILTFNASDLKKKNLLSRLVTDSKRDNFEKGEPSDNLGTALVSNKVVLPNQVYCELKKYIESPKVTTAMRKEGGPEVERKMRMQNLSVMLWNAGKVGYISRPSARKIVECISKGVEVKNKNYKEVSDLLERISKEKDVVSFPKESVYMVRQVIRDCAPFLGDKDLYNLGQKKYGALNRPLKKGVISPTIALNILEFIREYPIKNPLQSAVISSWIDIVENEEIVWSRVEKVERTGKRETGYDLTVPGYETFANIDGVILSNTINVHALLTPEAVKDAKEKLLPSKSLFTTRSHFRTMPEPKQDIVLGMYLSQRGKPSAKHSFRSEKEFETAIESGNVRWNDEVEISHP